jgi:WD40 repeat protein/predicted Ser/Thr protein kinase
MNGSDTDIDKAEGRVPRPALTTELPFSQLGPYQIVARLGSGGMGDVYKGYDDALGRYVAIKVLPAELARSEDFVARFRQEASAAAKVEHPHIVPIYTIGVDQGRHFFAMQFVEGQTLAEQLHHQPRPPLEWTLRIIAQVLEGLAAAHRQGLVHRDIKPANVLLADGGRRAMLADFGLVKSASEESRITATGVIMGTVDYISPEQGRGKPVDQRSDLYSIGVLLYQMLAGRLPFQADSPTAMIFQHAYEPPPPLAEAAIAVPSDLARIVHRLLAKSPDDRYQSCADLLKDLAALDQGLSPAPRCQTAGSGQTAIVFAPELEGDAGASVEEAASDAVHGWGRACEKWYQRLWLWLSRRAPELVQQLQNTNQQVNQAVLNYEERCHSLRRLVAEAESVQRLLATQLAAHQQAADDAQRQAVDADDEDAVSRERLAVQQNDEAARQLSQQIEEQREQLEKMQLALAKANARLVQLRAQRDALHARLKIAYARYGLHDARPKPRAWPRLAAVSAACLLMIVIVAAGAWRSWDRSPQTVSDVGPDAAGAAATTGELGAEAGKAERLELALDPTGQWATMPAEVTAITWMPNPGTAASYQLMLGCRDGTLWDLYVMGGKLPTHARRWAAHAGPITALSFNRPSQRLASSGNDGEVLIWERNSERLARRLSHGNSIAAISFSPLGDQLLAGTHTSVHCWDVAAGNELQRYSQPNGASSCSRSGLAWLPDESAFLRAANAVGNIEKNFLVPLEGGHSTPLSGATGRLRDVAFFRGGEALVALAENTVSVWDHRGEDPARSFGDDVLCAAYSEFGAHTLTGHSDGRVTLWNTFTGQKLEDVAKLPAAVSAVSMTPGGQWGAAVCGNRTFSLRIFPLPAERVPNLKSRFALPAAVRTLDFAPYEFTVVAMDQQQVRLWRLEPSTPSMNSIPGVTPAATATFSPEGTRLLMAYAQSGRDGFGPLVLAQLRQSAIKGDPEFRRYQGHAGGTNAALFLDNGSRILSGGNDNHLRIWDRDTEQQVDQLDVGQPVRALAVLRDDKVIVIGDSTDPQIWDLAARSRLGKLTGHALLPRQLAVAHQADRAVTISGDRTARVWDTKTLQCIAVIAIPGMPTSVAMTSNGEQIIIGSEDGTVRLWEASDNDSGAIIGTHNGGVTALSLSGNGDSVVSAGEDLVLCWWQVPSDEG